MTRLEVPIHLRLRFFLANEERVPIAARTIVIVVDAKPTVKAVQVLQLKL